MDLAVRHIFSGLQRFSFCSSQGSSFNIGKSCQEWHSYLMRHVFVPQNIKRYQFKTTSWMGVLNTALNTLLTSCEPNLLHSRQLKVVGGPCTISQHPAPPADTLSLCTPSLPVNNDGIWTWMCA